MSQLCLSSSTQIQRRPSCCSGQGAHPENGSRITPPVGVDIASRFFKERNRSGRPRSGSGIQSMNDVFGCLNCSAEASLSCSGLPSCLDLADTGVSELIDLLGDRIGGRQIRERSRTLLDIGDVPRMATLVLRQPSQRVQGWGPCGFIWLTSAPAAALRSMSAWDKARYTARSPAIGRALLVPKNNSRKRPVVRSKTRKDVPYMQLESVSSLRAAMSWNSSDLGS